MRTLLVEDDDILRSVWADGLRDAGHEVTDCGSIVAATQAMRFHSFDMIVADLQIGAETSLPLTTLAGYLQPNAQVMMVTGSNLFPHGELYHLCPNLRWTMRKPMPVADLVALAAHVERELSLGESRIVC